MTTSTAVSQLLTRWAHLYGHTPVSATVTYLHLVGILMRGGVAVAADRASLRLSPTTPDWSQELARLASVHRWVVGGLALIFASGLLGNGYIRMRAETALRQGVGAGWSGFRRASLAGLVLWLVAALLQTAAAVTVLNVAPVPVRRSDSTAAAIARRVETPWMIHPDQARRFLTLQHRSQLTESLGCMIAKSVARPCSLQRIGPASVARSQSTRGAVVPEQTGDEAGGSRRRSAECSPNKPSDGAAPVGAGPIYDGGTLDPVIVEAPRDPTAPKRDSASARLARRPGHI